MEPATTSIFPRPEILPVHPNLSDEINRNIVKSEIEGGVHLSDVGPGEVLAIQTRNHDYRLVHLGDGAALLSGHPRFCPSPTPVRIHGSTWGGSMIRDKYLGRGMRLEFGHPEFRVVITSPIVDIRSVRE